MTKLIDTLTPEQEAMLPEFVAFGLRIGLRTERADRDAADAAIRAHYRACGLAEPKAIRWFDSPYAEAEARNSDCIEESLGDSVYEYLRESVREVAKDNVRESVRGNVEENVEGKVRDSVRDSDWTHIRRNIRASVGDSLWGNLGAHYDADAAAWIKAWDHFGVPFEPKVLTYLEMTGLVWWMFPGEEVVYASEPPVAIHRNAAGRLHHDEGKAVAFADGTGFSAWNGVIVPDRWVLERDTIAHEEILAEPDVETRTAGCALIGWHRLPHTVIDSDPDPAHGQLIEIALEGLPEPGRFLKAQCPRNGTICEGVPREIDTVLAAQAWRVGLDPAEFSYPPVRT